MNYYKKSVENWVETVVIGLNFCPFAKREIVNNRVRYTVLESDNVESLIYCLKSELTLLLSDNTIETTLLIHPNVLQDFDEYNQFLDVANETLIQQDLEGVIQIASFHPDYQFAGTAPDDAENYTNKSPYPILHLIREESLALAISNYPNVDLIPENNIKKTQALGSDNLNALLQKCFSEK